MIDFAKLKSYQDTPDPLILLCCREIIRNLEKTNETLNYKLPAEVGHLLFAVFRNEAQVDRWRENDIYSFLHNFKHKFIPLSRINLSGLKLKTEFFLNFITKYKKQLVEINISNCGQLEPNLRKFNEILKCNKSSYKTLNIGETFSRMIEREDSSERLFDDDLKLEKLILHNLYCTSDDDEFTINRRLSKILTPTMSCSLKYLDLSACTIGKGSALMQLESLEILVLYDCSMKYKDLISTICQLRKLKVLDISRQFIEGDDITLPPQDPKLLELLVSRLPNLTRLDISGTNLIGVKDRSTSAFECRAENPFEVLGLFHTVGEAAYRSCIPARIVVGEANELQVLNACEAYINRPGQLTRALGDLYNLYKTTTPSQTFDDVNRALDVVLPILTKHLSDEQVMIYATAALWCIVKINVTSKNLNDACIRRTIVSRLLDVMQDYKHQKTILVNGGLSLLLLPEITYEHSRAASISLHMCRDDDARAQGFGVTLLNSLACQVGGDQKVSIGNLYAIETMVDIIKNKIKEDTCDEILETAWSTLWNITDETPINCEKFLSKGGLEAFEDCMDKFGQHKEVLRNIMGLLGNVAECQKLRINFMHKKYLQRFRILLDSRIDGIECSYNACGTLAYLVSDGQKFWERNLSNDVVREEYLSGMRGAISSWPINSRRNINYRSFEPIIRLLDTDIVAEAQYWAVFALTNLTRINPAKYCPMMLPHDGLIKMHILAQPGVTKPYVTNLAKIAIFQYERFAKEKTLSGLEQTDSVNLEEIEKFQVSETNQNEDAVLEELDCP